MANIGMQTLNRRAAKLDAAGAEAIAAQALGFLAHEPRRLMAFLVATGLEPADVRQRVDSPEFLAAVLDFVSRDESLLIVFAAEAGLPPERVAAAAIILTGDHPS